MTRSKGQRIKYFTIEHEKKDRIPFIKEAQKIANNGIKLFWFTVEPASLDEIQQRHAVWRKLKPEYDQTWADFFAKYIKAFENEGISIWVSPSKMSRWLFRFGNRVFFTAEEERDFVKNYLGPTLKKNDLSDVKVMIWDHNRGICTSGPQVGLRRSGSSKYVWGTGFHWYVGNHYDNVRLVHDA